MSSYKIPIVQQKLYTRMYCISTILKDDNKGKRLQRQDKRRANGLTQKGNERLKELRIKDKSWP